MKVELLASVIPASVVVLGLDILGSAGICKKERLHVMQSLTQSRNVRVHSAEYQCQTCNIFKLQAYYLYQYFYMNN